MNVFVVYSLGIRCYTEIILKRLNLIKFSSIFGSMNMKNYNNIIKCFDTNFEILFSKDNLLFSKDNLNFNILNKTHGFRTLHKIFDNVLDYHTSTIAHHDLSNEAHQTHFKRGVERLIYIRNNKIPILFVNISHISEFKNNINESNLIDSIKKNGFINMKLISIFKDNNVKELILNDISEFHIIYTIPSYGYDDPRDDKIIETILLKYFKFDNLLNKEELI
jgi:hypothetical protein